MGKEAPIHAPASEPSTSSEFLADNSTQSMYVSVNTVHVHMILSVGWCVISNPLPWSDTFSQLEKLEKFAPIHLAPHSLSFPHLVTLKLLIKIFSTIHLPSLWLPLQLFHEHTGIVRCQGCLKPPASHSGILFCTDATHMGRGQDEASEVVQTHYLSELIAAAVKSVSWEPLWAQRKK